MEKWFIRNREGDLKKISKDLNISEFLSKLLVNRQILDYKLIESFLDPKIDRLHNPKLMKDLSKGANIIKDSIINKKRIRIVGDYDVDGVISIYLLYTSIKKLGGDVDYIIPNRIDDGYGINMEIIKHAKEDGIHTIITCDNGIAALNEMKFAKDLGLNIIITDHHEPIIELDNENRKKQILPIADAVINPKRLDCDYPFKYLCGAAVSFKLIQEIYLLFNKPLKDTYPLLEYTAIATVCDVVDLIDENRIIVKYGLKLLNNTKNIGLKALIRESGIEEKEIGVYHIGFIIGPSINASGRLDSALKALELLLSNDIVEASLMARELRELNEERKQMTVDGVEKIIKQIENSSLAKDRVLVIYEPDIHESIAGIIAGRIKDRYNKPTIVLTKGKDGVKGSGRSIEEYNMFYELSKAKDILSKFGGHPMAAGLTLEYNNIEILRTMLNKNTRLTDDDIIRKIYIDMHLPIEYINFNLIRELNILEPFGKGNSKPIFGEKNLRINRGFILGKNRNVLKMELVNKNNKSIEGMYFGDVETFKGEIIEIYGEDQLNNLLEGRENNLKVDILYYPSINEFNGNTRLQVIIDNYRFIR